LAEITLGRKVNTGNYESAEFRITVSGDDIPRDEGEEIEGHLNRLYFRCYRALTSWEYFNRYITLEEAKQRITRFKKSYKVGDE
jgi:hypothetical protein